MPMVDVAPCQCFTLGGNQTMSPGRTSSFAPPSTCTQPQPAMTMTLAERMGMPGGACAGLERDGPAAHARRGGAAERRINPLRR